MRGVRARTLALVFVHYARARMPCLHCGKLRPIWGGGEPKGGGEGEERIEKKRKNKKRQDWSLSRVGECEGESSRAGAGGCATGALRALACA